MMSPEDNHEDVHRITTVPEDEEEKSDFDGSGGVFGQPSTSPTPTAEALDEIDDEELQQELKQIAREWDEGGPSQCGYHEVVHDALMTFGRGVHFVVGEPSEPVESGMNSIGNWFQEASYALRDFIRGDKIMVDDTVETASQMGRDTITAVSSILTEKSGNHVEENVAA